MKHGHGVIELRAADLIVGEEAQPLPKKRRKPRRPTIAGALAQVTRAGVAVKAVSIAPDGTITIVPGQPGASEFNNEWDEAYEQARTAEIRKIRG
jgi:hypothetical protein